MLKLEFFGGFKVRLQDTSLAAFDTDKSRALLAYLAAEAGRPQPRETLLGLFWPEAPETKARHSLSQALYALRSQLSQTGSFNPLDTKPQTVMFKTSDACLVDVHEFNRLALGCPAHRPNPQGSCPACLEGLQEAEAVYQGEFLAGFSLPDCEAFEAWQVLQREALGQKMKRTLDLLARQGNLTQALVYARRQVSLDELDDAAQRQLMRLLAGLGQRSAALAQYAACQKALAEGLGIEPEPETARLYREILAQPSDPDSSSPEKVPAAERADLPARRHNLPAALTPLIGRESEMAQISARLTGADCRLLTLAGLGGCGKTRLALEVGRRLGSAFPDGVYLVDLDTGPSSAQALLAGISNVIGLEQSGRLGGPQPAAVRSSQETELIAWEQVWEFLRAKEMLLILDGCETILDQIGNVLRLLSEAPRLKLLVTSRVSLNLQGEALFVLDGLAYPANAPRGGVLGEPVEDTGSVSSNYGAVQLFLAAARRAQPAFELNPANRKDVLEICRLCQGLPLGILLAAAWVATITPRTISQEIQHSLDLLTTIWRDLPERQRSLRATFDYSLRLLGDEERAVLLRLAVFHGTFSAAQARQVAGASIVHLKILVNGDLLQPRGGERFRMHSLLQQYALEKLAAHPEENIAARDRHAAVFCIALQAWEARLKSSALFAALDEMNQHEPDLRAAWNWAVGRAQLEQLQMGAGGLGRFYFLCDRYSEGQVLFEHAFHGVNALKQSETLLVRACLANQAVLFLIWIKEFERARKILHEILEAYPLETELSFELRRQRALTWQALGDFQYNLREEPLTVALATYQKALQELRRCGTDWDRVEILLRNAECHEQAGNPLSNTLNLALEAQEVNAQIGDASLANQIKKQISAVRTLLGQYDEAIRIARELEVYYQGIYTQCSQVWYRGWMGWTYWLAGRLDEAREQLLMAADLKRQGGPFYPSYVNCIMELYNVDLFQGHYADVHNLTVGKIFQVDEPRRYIPWGYAEGLLGVLEGDYDRAMVDFNRWLDFCAKTPRPNGLGGALAFVGLTCLRQGERETGRQKLEEALEASLTYEWVFNYDCLLAVLALLLAEEGQTERALQVYAAACQEPLVATSVYFADLVGRRLLAQARSLPEAVYRAAWEKGQSMEMRAMTLELREELRQGTLLRTV